MLVFAGVGVHSAMDITAAAAVTGYLPTEHVFPSGQTFPVDSFQKTALGFVFFTWLTIFPIIGLAIGVAGRGLLSPAGDKGWFAYGITKDGAWNRNALPLQIALLIWAAAHMLTIWHFDQGQIAARLKLGGLAGEVANGYVG